MLLPTLITPRLSRHSIFPTRHINAISLFSLVLLSVVYIIALPPGCYGNEDAKRLYDDLLGEHDMMEVNLKRVIRPVQNISEKLMIKLGLKLDQIIDVDEKNEIITTNVWQTHEWTDYKLTWDPAQYGNVQMLYVPSEHIWTPDIVLYNNADTPYTITMFNKATIWYNGTVHWEPPAIYKSYCSIDVEYFPFDEQKCILKFGTWTYSGTFVELQHVWFDRYHSDNESILIDPSIDLEEYYSNSEWNLMKCTARKNRQFYPCCVEPYLDVTFEMTIRRKTLFYTVNLLIPCVAINMLTYLAFYLPADCGEKMSLCISILLSLSLFQLLLIDLMPPTSLKIPLLGKYILFTTTVVSLSVLSSVMVLSIHFNSPATHTMPRWVRRLFLTFMPRLLLMQTPHQVAEQRRQRQSSTSGSVDYSGAHCDLSNYANPYAGSHMRPIHDPGRPSSSAEGSVDTRQARTSTLTYRSTFVGFDVMQEDTYCEACAVKGKQLPLNAHKALEGVFFIAKHIKDDDRKKKLRDEWKYVAMVVDRLLLWVYTAGCIGGAAVLLLNAPVLFDDKLPLPENYRVDEPYAQAVARAQALGRL